jgi:hypothetical protein
LNFACIAILAAAATACSTQRTADEAAMQRAYEMKVNVTGSRVRRKVDPETGEASTGYQVITINGDAARTMIRGR